MCNLGNQNTYELSYIYPTDCVAAATPPNTQHSVGRGQLNGAQLDDFVIKSAKLVRADSGAREAMAQDLARDGIVEPSKRGESMGSGGRITTSPGNSPGRSPPSTCISRRFVILGKSARRQRPQWMILMALVDLESGRGRACEACQRCSTLTPSSSRPSRKCSRRRASCAERRRADDARVVQMSLTDKQPHRGLASSRRSCNSLIFAESVIEEARRVHHEACSLEDPPREGHPEGHVGDLSFAAVLGGIDLEARSATSQR